MIIKKLPLLVTFLLVAGLLTGASLFIYRGYAITMCLKVAHFGYPLPLFQHSCVLNTPEILCGHEQPSCSLTFIPLNIIVELIIWIATSLFLYYVYINILNRRQKT